MRVFLDDSEIDLEHAPTEQVTKASIGLEEAPHKSAFVSSPVPKRKFGRQEEFPHKLNFVTSPVPKKRLERPTSLKLIGSSLNKNEDIAMSSQKSKSVEETSPKSPFVFLPSPVPTKKLKRPTSLKLPGTSANLNEDCVLSKPSKYYLTVPSNNGIYRPSSPRTVRVIEDGQPHGILVRSKSESHLGNEERTPSKPKLGQRRSLHKDSLSDEKLSSSAVLEELLRNTNVKDSLLRKFLERKSRKLMKEKSIQALRSNSIDGGKTSPIANQKNVLPHRKQLGLVVPQPVRRNSSERSLDRIKEEAELSESDNERNEAWERRRKRWIGVNGEHDHNHVFPDTPPQHNRFNGVPKTPHIIVSPEVEEKEPFFSNPEDEMPEVNNEQVEQPSSTPPSTPKQSYKVQGPESTEEVLDRVADNEIPPPPPPPPPPPGDPNNIAQKDAGGMKPQVFRNYSEDSSSSENSPVEERGAYFTSHDIPVGVSGAADYVRPPNHHQRLENNLASGMASTSTHSIRSLPPSLQSPFRSISMASLDPADPYMRKTRRNSMIGMMRRVSSQSNLGLPTLPPQIGRSNSRISLMTTHHDWREEMNESLILCVSALYAKLLVVMGMAFPIAETISKDVPLIFYNSMSLFQSFYLYLYFGSILFLIYAYLFLLRAKSFTTVAIKHRVESLKMKMPKVEVNWRGMPMPNSVRNILPKKKEPDPKSEKAEKLSVSPSTYKPPKYTITESSNHGSMYLKMGAVIFGIGSMIYSGLEFGQYFELRSDPACANMLMAITPVARMIFTFLQMYFIFLNSRVAISKHTIIARFGLMHMIGTNLCIWLNVLVQETKHEIEHLTSREDAHPNTNMIINNTHKEHGDSHGHGGGAHSINGSEVIHHIVRRAAGGHHNEIPHCKRLNLMGHVVNSASPFLFPCTIEYSLLCAGVLYVMWKNINVSKPEKNAVDGDSDISTFIARKVRHHYSVDCARASRGLFMGIFILVLTIISLILFYVLISNEQFKTFAILEANIIEVSIYSLAIISVIVGMKQMRELEFILEGDIELDNILLIIAQAGVYIYTSFTIIGGYFSLQEIQTLPLLTAIMTLIQTTLQTLFILDGSRRCCYTADQLDRKPGREMVTFLLVCNLAMWAISTFETSRADVHPTQLHFYGIWAWTIISHVSMPLAIFYRFHVTVCLGEIWKRAYKLKHDFM